MTDKRNESKHQRHKRLARESAKRMAARPNERMRLTLFKHLKGMCE